MSEIIKLDPQEFGLEVKTAEKLTTGLVTTIKERDKLIESYNNILDLEVTQENIPKFKDLRLKLVKNRTSITSWHKNEKAFYLAGGRFVDAIKNKEIEVNKNMEEKLLASELHFKKLEEEKIEKLRSERWAKLSKFQEIEPRGLDLMEEEVFNALLIGAETKKKAEIEAAEMEKKRLEEEKIKVELYNSRKEILIPFWNFLKEDHKSADFSELPEDTFIVLLNEAKEAKLKKEAADEAQRIENKKLKEAAEKREAEIKKQNEAKAKKEEQERIARKKEEDIRKAAEEKKLKEEREKREKLEAEIKAKKDEEAKIAKQKKDLELAPDKEKLNDLIQRLKDFEVPEVKSKEAKEIVEAADKLINKTVVYINSKIELI